MAELWFSLCALMVAVYAAADGFDLGAGTLHLALARRDAERRQVISAIGPYWDGNEVWLLALAGALFLAFPPVLAASFSGLYLAIVIVVWLLILRGIAIEFRSHVPDGLWRAFWDVVFAGASAALPLLFGTALGNILRGFPLDADGWFTLPLFASFSPYGALGILDTYTLSAGVLAFLGVALHGAHFLAWKTDGAVAERARRAARILWFVATPVWALVAWYTFAVAPRLQGAFAARPAAWALFALALAGWVQARVAAARGRDLAAFLGSTAWIVGLLAATAASAYPVLLHSTTDAHPAWTVLNAASGTDGLATAARWWFAGAPLAVLYFAVLLFLHRGKVAAGDAGYGP